MLEVAPEDLEWRRAAARWSVKGDPEQGATIQEIAMAARGAIELPEGIEAGLDAEAVYDPPNLTFPFGAYICVVDVDPGTAVVKVRRFVAVDDCGVRINPMIVEGQIHGGLTDGVGMALMEHDRVRRGRQLPRRLADGLPDPDGGRGARLGDRLHRHAVAAPSDRCQGDRRVRDGRLAARRSSTRSATRSACGTWTCRARRRGCGTRCEEATE